MGPYWSEAITDEAHITLASLLNGSSALHEHVDILLVHKVRFVDRQGSPEDVACSWRSLEVNEEILPPFVELNPFWDGCNLLVNKAAESDRDIMEKLSGLVLYCCRWLQWSSSRWC